MEEKTEEKHEIHLEEEKKAQIQILELNFSNDIKKNLNSHFDELFKVCIINYLHFFVEKFDLMITLGDI
jgi:hypothetical protein